jgi:hypothetical protein
MIPGTQDIQPTYFLIASKFASYAGYRGYSGGDLSYGKSANN